MTRGGILSLDLSSKTGWCYGMPGAPFSACVYDCWFLPQRTLGARLNAFRTVFVEALEQYKPTLVFKEAAIAHFIGDPPPVVYQQIGLSGVVEMECADFGIRVADQEPSTIREAVMGRGQFPKGEAKRHVLAWAHEQGIDCGDNDNIADACAGFRFASNAVVRREALTLT